MSTTLESDISLLQKVALGDTVSFSIIYYKYQPKIYQYSLRLLQSPQQAEEIVQEVMLKLWMLGHKLNEIENIDAWLKRVTRNRAIDILRTNKLNPTYRGNTLDHVPEEGLNFTEEIIRIRDARRLLDEAIKLLPEQQRRVYLLSEEDGLDAENIALLLGLKINTVYTHLKLARRSLKKNLSKYLDFVVIGIILKFF